MGGMSGVLVGARGEIFVSMGRALLATSFACNKASSNSMESEQALKEVVCVEKRDYFFAGFAGSAGGLAGGSVIGGIGRAGRSRRSTFAVSRNCAISSLC